MNLNAALSIASGGLANVNRQLGVVSHNVANAGTDGYVRETGTQQNLSAGGVGMGVRTGPALRELDARLQAELLAQGADTAGLEARQVALQAIDALHGVPGQGGDLASLLGELRDRLTALANDPQDQTQQRRVVSAANALATGLNALSAEVETQRQAAQDAIVADVRTLNTALAVIDGLTGRIIALKAADQGTADLEDQRDRAVQTVSALIGVKRLDQPNGGLILAAQDGLLLPQGASAPFAFQDATTGPGAFYPGGGLQGLTLGGIDVTARVTAGRIGGNLALRDQTLPAYQAGFDELAETLATRFEAQGLRLFTDPAGAVPPTGGVPVQAGYVGFAGTIRVNPVVQADAALVRDGTHTTASFTPNPPGGPAGFTTLITRVLDSTLGRKDPTGATWTAPAITGLGPSGALAASYAAPATLQDFATSIVASQSQASGDASARLDAAQSLHQVLQARLAERSGVNIDAEMSIMVQLQGAYGANARVIAAVQSMWSQLLNAVG